MPAGSRAGEIIMGDWLGKDTGKLGFGMMRLPKKAVFTDVKQTKRMVDLFLDAGFTYFDTAHVYQGSEDTMRKALVMRHPRDSYTIATKLYAPSASSEKQARKQFETSLSRLGTDYIDYYLLHSLMGSNFRKYDQFHLWDYVKGLKEEGKIRHIGFSFHDGPELLEKLLKAHPEVEFVQLQINYADWENPSVTSRRNYEVARKYGKAITVMEPVKGGALADPPTEVKKLFKEYHPDLSCASWAVRFAASLEGILTVLSGMSNMDQMRDNLSYMKDFQPLNPEEQAIIRKAQRIMQHSSTSPCTACRYCVEGCPKKILIPDIFHAMNLQLGNGQLEAARKAYAEAAEKGSPASACIRCRKCEGVCPQHLPITEHLEEAAAMFEKG